jgi:arylsulfatase A-like enzyme
MIRAGHSNMSQTTSPALKPSHTLKLVSITVLATLAAWYGTAILSFTGHTYGFNNRFTEVAIRHHWWYLLWNNIIVMKGYLLVALGYVALIYPLIQLWREWRPFNAFGVIWRTAILSGLGYGYFIFRLIMHKPYFGDYGYMETWYTTLGVWFGPQVQGTLHFVVMFFIPALFISVASGWYLYQLWKAFQHPLLMRRFSIAVGLLLCAFVATSYGLTRDTSTMVLTDAPKPKPKNILIIGSDSLRADHLSCNGYHRPTSPAIDQLSLSGVNFTRCLTPIASTLESMSSMFSSQYPHTHGIHHMFPSREMVDRVNTEAPSLAELLNAQGYDTAVIGDWCACGFNELPMGFNDVIVSDFDNFRVYMSEVVFLHHQILPLFFDNRVGHMLFPKLKSFANYMTPDVVTNQVIDRLQERSEDEKPFLMFAFYSCTHLPYKTPRAYSELWTQPNYTGKHQHELALNVDEFIGSTDINQKWKTFPEKEVEQITALYDGCVRMFDDCVGRIVQSLKDEGLLDSTIVLITGDHGDDLFEPGTTFGHGMTFNGGDQSNHVPAVFYVPGLETKGRKVDRIVRTIDFAPTLVDLLGMQPDPRFEGTSLAPYLRGETEDLNLAFFGESSYLFFKRHIPGEQTLHIPPMDETTFIDPEFNFHFVLKDKYQEDVIKTKERTVRTERFKLVKTPGQGGAIIRLFDLHHDPHCERDVKDRFPDITERMNRALDRWSNEREESTIREILGDIDEAAIQAR